MGSLNFEKYGIIVPPGINGQIKTFCPECQNQRKNHPKDKPLSVNADDGTFKCHHCGWSGRVKDDNEQYLENKIKPKVYRKPENVKLNELPDEVAEWFWSRRITQEVIKRNKITHGKFWFPQVSKELQAIQFPYFDGEEIINVKARRDRPERLFSQSKDAKPIPYKINDIRGRDEFVITEGESDCLSWEVAGIINCCSSPGGAINENDKNIDGKLKFLEFIQDEVEKAKWIYIATDNDAPGRRFEKELARRIGKEKCKRIKYHDDCKDANDVLCKHGAEELKKLYDNAEPYPIDGLIQFRDIADEIVQIYLDGFRRSVSTGLHTLDNHYTVREGELTVVSGVPSHGKSEFVGYIITHLALVEKWKFAVYSPEHHPLARYFAKLARSYIGKPFNRGHNERMDKTELLRAIAELDNAIKPIFPKTGERKIDSILKLARINVYRHGIKGLVIDPWNRIEHERKNYDQADYVAATLDRIQEFARINDIHIWIVAHPKLLMQKKDGEYVKPTLYSISGGANWKNCTDHGLIVWRDMETQSKVVEVFIEKIKYEEIGSMGHCVIGYNPVSGRYFDLPSVNGNQNGKHIPVEHHLEFLNKEQNENQYEKTFDTPTGLPF